MSTELTAPGSSSILIKKIRPSDLILTVLIDLAAAFSILLLIAIMGYVFLRGLPQISLSFLTSVPSTIKGTFGIAGNIVNTLYIIILTLLIATPIGVGSAIYLNEYAKPGKIVRLIEFTTETLSGIPSIIFGLFGMVFFGTNPGTWLFHPDRCPDPDPDGSSPDHAKHTGSLKNSSCDLPQRRTRHRRNQMVHDPHNPASLRNARHYHRYHTCDRTYRRRICRPFIHRRKRLSSAQDLCRIFQKNLRIRRNPYDPAVLEHVQGTI